MASGWIVAGGLVALLLAAWTIYYIATSGSGAGQWQAEIARLDEEQRRRRR